MRVLDCNNNGNSATAVAGIDWVTANGKRPAVVNVSLGGPVPNPNDSTPTAIDTAVRNSIGYSNLTYIISAGNSSFDACAFTPARVKGVTSAPAIIVGAVNPSNDARWSTLQPQLDANGQPVLDPNGQPFLVGSNYGKCVDLFAPGVNILSAGIRTQAGSIE